MATEPLTIVIVGIGPRGTGILERLLANIGELLPDRPVQISLVDPFPPGAGRVWREQQSPLMLMNVQARDVTMFTDETVRCAGPIRKGPSLSEWAAENSQPEPIAAGAAFASRSAQGRYLSWVFERLIAERPATVTVSVLPTVAVRIDGTPGGQQRVWLADYAQPLPADVVVLSLGHLDVVPGKEDLRLAAFAAENDLRYLPPCYTADTDLTMFRPGEKIAMRGLGLAFIDLMVLLTEGRGGRYEPAGGRRLSYLPSGAEPVMYVGSRRGVPYRAKIDYQLTGAPPPLPRFFDAAAMKARFAHQRRLDFYADLWPDIAKEVGWGYYHQLFTAHPGRVSARWPDFADAYAELDWDEPEMRDLIESSVPGEQDRLDFDTLDRPLDGMRFGSLAELHDRVHGYVAADLDRRASPTFSPDLAAHLALLSVHAQMPTVLAHSKLSARSYATDLTGWWKRFFEYASSGPPSERLRQLIALSEAGIVHFLGAGMWAAPDSESGMFRAGGRGAQETIEVTALVEARLPSPTLHNSVDSLLAGLHADGAASELVLVDEDGFEHCSGALKVSETDFQLIDRSGFPQPGRYAIGPYTSARHFATFARPRTNAVAFRQNDALARSVLMYLAGPQAEVRLAS